MSPSREPFLGLQGTALSWAISLSSASAFLLFGYDQGIMGSIISTPYFLEAINVKATNADTISTIVSIYDIGCMAGCLVAAVWGLALGRKRTIGIGMAIMIVGAALQCSSYSVAQLIVGRVISGIGNGMNTGTVPTWVSETSKAKSRGQLVATQLSIAAFGIVIAYWMNYGFFHLQGPVVWRFPIAFQIFFAILTLIALPFMPESPRWLYSKGRTEEADVVMTALKALPLEHEFVQAERAEILAAIALEDHFGEYSIKTIFIDKSGQRIPYRMALVFIIQMIQQLPGVNIVIYYSSTVFLQLGISARLSLILGGVASLCFWIGSLLGIALIERVGRKKLLVSGTIPMVIGYCIYTPMVKNGGTTQLWVAFAATCLICVAFGWSWLPVPWCLGPELVPVRYRHIGNALNAFANWTFTFIIVKVGPIGIANIHWRLYIVFIIFTFLQLPIVWFLYPETRGRTLEETDTLFIKDPAVTETLTEKAQAVHHFEDKQVAATIANAVEADEVAEEPSSVSQPEWPLHRAKTWLDNPANLRFAEVTGASLPPRPIADDYVKRCFQTAHRLYPVLNRVTFMERYKDFWEGLPTEGKGYELWAAVLYMLLAHGHQCSTVDPDSRIRSQNLAVSYGETCFKLAKATFADSPFAGGDVSAVYAMFLAFLWLFNQQRLHEAYAMLGAASRVGYAIGMHREIMSPETHVLDINGWCASWWCLFIYETELAALSGRPCGIQPREVDIRPFPVDTSPIDFQYIERMRQFSYLAWDAYEQVYSLAYKYSGVIERASALRAADGAICAWYESWCHDALWSEPHGLCIRLRESILRIESTSWTSEAHGLKLGYLNYRILLYRAFLNLVVQKREKRMEVKDESLTAAAKCLEMALSLIQLTTTSVNPGSSGTLQAAVFSAMGYLWSATLTLLLYVKSDLAQEILSASTPDRSKIIEAIDSAAAFFAMHEQALPFARVAAEKITRLLKKAAPGYVSNETPSTSADIHAAFAVPTDLESPDQLLNFIPGFDAQTFNFDLAFSEAPLQDEVFDLEPTSLQHTNPHWSPDGEGFYFYGTPEPG